MDWFNLRNTQVKVVTEQTYRGIECKWVENKGWKIVLGDEEYQFSCYQDARRAIDKIHESVVKEHGGAKIKSSTEERK